MLIGEEEKNRGQAGYLYVFEPGGNLQQTSV